MAGESFIAPPIEHLAVSIDVPEPYERNPRRGNVDQVAESLRVNGQYRPIVVNRRDNRILAGNHTWRAARQLGWTHIAVTWVDVDDAAARRIVLVDNRASDLADYDDRLLAELLADVEDLAGTGYDPYDIDELATRLLEEAGDGSGEGPADGAKEGTDGEPATPKAPPSLAERFGVPPFTVLDTRQGYWQDRKRHWTAAGIDSGDGREHVPLYGSSGKTDPVSAKINAMRGDGPSIFDPVLAELAVRWFSPPGGRVLDPFAGGSVRGLVAAICGRSYHGIDLRPEQVDANRAQAERILTRRIPQAGETTDPDALTPVFEHGGHLVKRDDLFVLAGVNGGKVRAAARLIGAPGVTGVVGVGARISPQPHRVAAVAAYYNLPCRVHTPDGGLTPELAAAADCGAELVGHRPGRNTVIIARARADAAERGWLEIPFGLEHPVCVAETAPQTANLPYGQFRRIVTAVGSGMSLAGILTGLATDGHPDIPVLGVRVGGDPTSRLDEYAPGWREQVTLVDAGIPYEAPAPTTQLGDVDLDPIYEAKCLPFLEDGDLLWIIGRRTSDSPAAPGGAEWTIGDSAQVIPTLPDEHADMILTCPPYYDIEKYSNDPADLSAMGHDAFDDVYRRILTDAARCLRPDRFAVIVVGNIRMPNGTIRDLRTVTTQAMTDGGMHLVNDAILLNVAGTAALRANAPFQANRGLTRIHQEVLVYAKGDRGRAATACGHVDFTDPADTPDDNPAA